MRRADLEREVFRCREFEGTIRTVADKRPGLGRGDHDACDGPAVLDEGDVHGELAVFLEELLGSIERVDEEEA